MERAYVGTACNFLGLRLGAAFMFLCCCWISMVFCDPMPMSDFGMKRSISSPSELVFKGFRTPPGKPLEEVAANVDTWPFLRGLGVASRRLVFPPCGQVSPHNHPRATELCIVLTGEVVVGLYNGYPSNLLLMNRLVFGDMAVFPMGLTHWMQNFGTKEAVLYCGLNAADPGYSLFNVQLFGSTTKMPDVLLRSAFALSTKEVREIKASTPIDDNYPRSGCVPGVLPKEIADYLAATE